MISIFKAVAKAWLLSYANENEPLDQPVRWFFDEVSDFDAFPWLVQLAANGESGRW